MVWRFGCELVERRGDGGFGSEERVERALRLAGCSSLESRGRR